MDGILAIASPGREVKERESCGIGIDPLPTIR
jgi:hypothetical protein